MNLVMRKLNEFHANHYILEMKCSLSFKEHKVMLSNFKLFRLIAFEKIMFTHENSIRDKLNQICT